MNINFTTKHGSIGGFELNDNKDSLKSLRDIRRPLIYESLKDYRVYYSQYDLITLYHAKEKTFKTLDEEMEYAFNGLQILMKILRMHRTDFVKLP